MDETILNMILTQYQHSNTVWMNCMYVCILHVCPGDVWKSSKFPTFMRDFTNFMMVGYIVLIDDMLRPVGMQSPCEYKILPVSCSRGAFMLQISTLLLRESCWLSVKNQGFRSKLSWIDDKSVCFDE